MLINRKECLKSMLISLKNQFEERDKVIFSSRNKKLYIVVKIKARSLKTEFGELKFKRYIYKYYNEKNKKWEYVALLDKELGLKKWSKLDTSLIDQIQEQVSSGKRYKDILDMFPEANLTTMTICRIFKAINNEGKKDEVIKRVKLEDKQMVYINTDDAFASLREKNKYKKSKIRVFSYNTGIDKKKSKCKRKILKDKKISYLISNEKYNPSTQEMAKIITEYGSKYYENFENATLVVGGDGAMWISNLARFLGAYSILDKFHAVRYLKEVFIFKGKRFQKGNIFLFRTCLNYFENGNYESLLEVLKIYADPKIVTYFRNNKLGIIHQAEKWNIGVSAESDISRLVKNPLGYGARPYSKETFVKIMNAKVYLINNQI